MKFVRQQAYAECAVVFMHVSVVGPYIHYRRKTPAVAGRKRTFEECGVLYRFGRKDGEYSQQVVCVVNWNSVQHNQVLVGTSPSHIHACKTFHAGLHTRHQLNGLQQVGFSQYGRGMPDLCHRYLMRSHGCAFYAGFPLVREYHDLCQLVIAVQPDVE